MAPGSRAPKYFQDPLYGQIAVSSPLLLRIIDAPALQRLRRVRQLGVSYLTFLGAEHSRFSHSLGAMALMGRALDHLGRGEGLALDGAGREVALAAALLHDVGHCAFSHTLERELIGDHEAMGARVVREDPGLARALGSRRERVALLLEGRVRGPAWTVVRDLLSSQIDVDRLDYLARDAHYTGVNSGRVDLDRIIGSLTCHRGRLAVKERGLLAVEEYFLARYFMYWKVYFHRTSRGLEHALKAVVSRATELWAGGEAPREGVSGPLAALLERGPRTALADFLDHDDSDVLVAVKAWRAAADPVLRGLAREFALRRGPRLLWEAGPGPDLSARTRARLRRALAGRGGLVEDRLRPGPYDRRRPVLVVGPGGVRELSRISPVVRAIARPQVRARYYVPAGALESLRPLLAGN